MPAIFDDLEIDTSDMLSNPKDFARRCAEKATELRGILRNSVSVATHTEDIKDKAKGTKVPSHIQTMLNDLYSAIDDLDDPADVIPCVDAIRRMVGDVDYIFKDKVSREVTMMSASVMDKRVAHQLYISLKKVYEHFKVTISIIDKNLVARMPDIPTMSGNYGGNLEPLKTYLYVFDDEPGEEYWNWYSVARKLGIYEDTKNYQDFVEYLDNNPNCGITVIEKVL